MLARARALWAVIAPIARPILATTVVGVGMSMLTREITERRELLATLNDEVHGRGRDLRTILGELTTGGQHLVQLRHDIAEAEQLLESSRRVLVHEQERADEGEVGSEAGADLQADELGAPINPTTGVAFG
jgi:hypothetical protein